MTTKQFSKLPIGTTVQWDEGISRGKVVIGRVPMFGGGLTDPVKHIEWWHAGCPTGDVTMGHDAAALKRISVT